MGGEAPDYKLAMVQHSEYVSALETCGLVITLLGPDEKHPDSTFIEDTALIKGDCAIITRPGVISRRTEILDMANILPGIFGKVERIEAPGTFEAGDVIMVGDYFYIGLSDRTNLDGAKQAIKILEKCGYKGSFISLEKVLHLKSGASYLENNNLLVCGEFVYRNEFLNFNRIIVPENEAYAANSLWVNGKVLVPSGFPKTLYAIQAAGYDTISVNMSEFQKLDGGLSCLSLRF